MHECNVCVCVCFACVCLGAHCASASGFCSAGLCNRIIEAPQTHTEKRDERQRGKRNKKDMG